MLLTRSLPGQAFPHEMRILTAVAIFGLVCLAGSADDNVARLLAAKHVQNQYLVEGRDLTVTYSIYNVGTSAALSVQLTDEGFPESDFKVKHGMPTVNWARIAPGTNVTHSIVLTPLKSGKFNFTAAELSYVPSEGTQPQIGYTSGPGEGGIMPERDYDRKFSPHILDWAAFAVMTLPSIGIPLMLWYSSNRKYRISSKAKKH
ncbi:SSR2 [Branchiostoma lanceolatum]|uniref:Translocon-associated protein subunit beta n=1 Tax=Branchiostoma lanceolatum TaxID=7740 RepID=A0A8K0ENE3_BRALA|nr:SSR2 [Branchiostoma lanceolatum]